MACVTTTPTAAVQDVATLLDFPKQISVLVVEDDFGDFDAVARALRKMTCFEARAVRAKTLEAARLAASDTSFDVMLIDYNLGAESGARFLKEMGGRGSRGVPILLTGLLDREVHEIALKAGAICCISKADLSPTLLETTIRYAIYTHRREAQISELLRAISDIGSHPDAAAAIRSEVAKYPWLTQIPEAPPDEPQVAPATEHST